MNPFFSIGVTTYNRPQMLRQNLLSILDQCFDDIEVVVCNDYIDTEVSAVTTGIDDSRIKFINNFENLGPLANHNLALEHCNGRYFTWLADDDLLSKGTLPAIYSALVEHDFPVCAYSSYRTGSTFENRNCPFSGKSKEYTGKEFVNLYLGRKVRVVGNYGFFDTTWLKELGGMKKLGTGTFSPYSDNLLAVTMLKLRRIVYLEAPFILYRFHPGSPSFASKDVATFRTAQSDFLKSTREIFINYVSDDDIDAYLLKVIRWCQDDIRGVANRSGKLQLTEIMKHAAMIWDYLTGMKGDNRKLRLRIFPWMVHALAENIIGIIKVKRYEAKTT